MIMTESENSRFSKKEKIKVVSSSIEITNENWQRPKLERERLEWIMELQNPVWKVPFQNI